MRATRRCALVIVPKGSQSAVQLCSLLRTCGCVTGHGGWPPWHSLSKGVFASLKGRLSLAQHNGMNFSSLRTPFRVGSYQLMVGSVLVLPLATVFAHMVLNYTPDKQSLAYNESFVVAIITAILIPAPTTCKGSQEYKGILFIDSYGWSNFFLSFFKNGFLLLFN